MKLDVSVELNLRTEEASKAAMQAAQLAMRDTVTMVARDAVTNSRKITGNNRRSIYYGVSGMGHEQYEKGRAPGDTSTGPDTSVIDESKLEGAVYSTSGYGGYLEVGTVHMAGIPYMKPALDKEFTLDKFAERIKRHMK